MLQNKINDLYSNFISYRTYSRWLDDKGRRETWEDSVQRLFNFIENRVPAELVTTFNDACFLVKSKQVMPSMRFLWSAGDAAAENNFAIYNCAYVAMDSSINFSFNCHFKL